MSNIQVRRERRTVYLDTSTLVDAFRGAHPESRRPTDPPIDDLLALVERISRECNLLADRIDACSADAADRRIRRQSWSRVLRSGQPCRATTARRRGAFSGASRLEWCNRTPNL